MEFHYFQCCHGFDVIEDLAKLGLKNFLNAITMESHFGKLLNNHLNQG